MRGNVLVRCGGELGGTLLLKGSKALSFDSHEFIIALFREVDA